MGKTLTDNGFRYFHNTENYGKVGNKPNFCNVVGDYLILLFVLTQKEAKKSSLNLARLKFYIRGVAKYKANFFYCFIVLFCLIAIYLATATPLM